MSDISNIQRQFGDHLFNFIKGRVHSDADTKDIYQDVLLKILIKSNQLNNTQSLKSWLFTIAKNQIVDYYRSKRRSLDLDEIPDLVISTETEVTDGYTDLEGCLAGFINRLPEEDRQIITQTEIEGKSQKYLSQSMGMNYVTLRSKVQRGREKIRKMIMDACIIEHDAVGVGCLPKSASPSCNNNASQACGP